MSPSPAASAARAAAVLRDLGFEGARVDVLGHEGEIAAVALPAAAGERLLSDEGRCVSSRLRELGFRYIALDLDPAP